MRARLTTTVAALAAGVAVLGGVAAVAHGSDSGDSGSKGLVITAEAQRRTLTDDVTLKGTVGRVEQRQVDAAGPGLVGAVHIDDGSTVQAGQSLLALDGRDAVAVAGDQPFFRSLDVGSRGQDVKQLEAVLAAAGYQPGPIDELYTEQTRFALAQWQSAHGYPGATPEHSETVTVSLGQGAGYTLGAETSAGVTIGAGKSAAPTARHASASGPARFHLVATSNPELTIHSVSAVTAEGSVAQFQLTANDVLDTDVTVTLEASGAAGASDVVLPPTHVVFPTGASSLTINVPTRQDDLVEFDENFSLRLLDKSGYRVGNDVEASTRIVSDDVPELSVEGTSTVAEGAATTVTVRADQAPAQDTQVSLALTGDATVGRDYRSISPVVTLPAGQLSVDVPIQVLTDDILEPDERIVAELAPGTGYSVGHTGAAVITIAKRTGTVGLPIVTVRPTATRVAEGQPVPLSVSLDHSLTEDLPLRLVYGGTALLGGDYTPAPGRVVVPAGQTSLSVQVPTVQDDVVEPDRVLTVTLAADPGYVVGGATGGVATIESDDVPELRLVGGGSVTEGGESVLKVVADQAPAEDTSVNYQVVGSATPGQDFDALTGTAVLHAGQVELTIPLLTLADDVQFEPTDMIAGHWPIRVGEVLVKEGAAVQAGTPLLSLTDAALTVTLKASASDRTKLKVGQKATVKLDGSTDEVDGTITELDDTATTDDQSKQSAYEGKVQIGDFAVADGAAVSIDVILDQKTDAIAVPIAAVKQDGSGHDVVRVLDVGTGKIHEARVKTGIAEGSYLEVVSGLQPGDVVIVEVDDQS